MALPLPLGLTHAEVAFLCEMEMVTVIPRQRLESIKLLSVRSARQPSLPGSPLALSNHPPPRPRAPPRLSAHQPALTSRSGSRSCSKSNAAPTSSLRPGSTRRPCTTSSTAKPSTTRRNSPPLPRLPPAPIPRGQAYPAPPPPASPPQRSSPLPSCTDAPPPRPRDTCRITGLRWRRRCSRTRRTTCPRLPVRLGGWLGIWWR